MAKKKIVSRVDKLGPSKSYLRFESVIQRSLDLLVLQQSIEKLFKSAGKDTVEQDMNDMTRGALVLGVAAMDSYFTSVFSERLVPYLKKKKTPSKSLVEFLSKAGLDTSVALELLVMERPYRRIRKIVDDYLERRVTQKFDVINDLFLAYNFKNFCEHAEKKTNRKTLLKTVGGVISRRHEIVHNGDLNSHGKLHPISPVEIHTKLISVVKFVAAADELLQRQLI